MIAIMTHDMTSALTNDMTSDMTSVMTSDMTPDMTTDMIPDMRNDMTPCLIWICDGNQILAYFYVNTFSWNKNWQNVMILCSCVFVVLTILDITLDSTVMLARV
jgi:hypothetical protein